MITALLQNGDGFPPLTIELVSRGSLVLPADLAGSYAVILFYRGSWCPFCSAQLAAFSRVRNAFEAVGIRIVALSVDDRTTSDALVAKLRLNFPVGFGADAARVASVTGAYLGGDGAYLQSTGFVLDRHGRILTAVYSSGAIGRLTPEDVLGFVRYVEAHEAQPASLAQLST
jgi:peroxiredoxin